MRVVLYSWVLVLSACSAARASETATASHGVDPVKEVSTGEALDLSKVLEPGRFTVLEFGSPQCGACRKLAPKVEAAARANDHFVLRTITLPMEPVPVAQQFQVRALPHFVVYDPQGKLVGSGYYIVDHILDWNPSQFTIGDESPAPPLWPSLVGFALILILGCGIMYWKMRGPAKGAPAV